MKAPSHSARKSPRRLPYLPRLQALPTSLWTAIRQPQARRISATYALLATLWIYFSDHALETLFTDPESVVKWSTYKGLFFVGFTALLLLALTGRAFQVIHDGYTSLQARTNQLQASQRHLATVIGSAMDAIVIVDHQQRVILFNAAAETMFNRTQTDAIGQNLSRFIPGGMEPTVDTPWVTSGQREDGTTFPIEAAVSEVGAGEERFQTAILRDISLREAHVTEIKRLNRLYSARSHINLAIVRISTQAELLQRICQILVGFGKFETAWIGWHDPLTERIAPVASYGDQNRYLETLEISSGGHSGARDPLVKAFTDGRPYVCNDLRNDSPASHWKQELEHRGFRASAHFPIRLGQKTTGVLNVYANSTGFFQDKESALLAEVAMDISFALDNLARREARQQAEAAVRSERLFSEAMIESTPGILYFYNDQGKFIRWNRNFERVTGYSEAEIAGMRAQDFFAPEDQDTLEGKITEVFEQGDSALEAPLVMKDGSTAPYFLTGKRIEFDGIPCLVGVGIDISDRRRMELELRVLNQTLESQVAQRTAELQTALIRAQGADRMKSAFLATMSHELRTPLNCIIGFTGILLNGLAGELNREQRKQLGMVQNSARHLLELINDVLDLSKIEAGQLLILPESFDLAASIDRVITSIRPLAEKKGLNLETADFPDLGPIVSDRRRLEQILINLLNNAIKFTESGGVQLNLEILEDCCVTPEAEPGRAFRIHVSGTGIGIEPGDLDALFQPFQQIDSGLTRQHEGTGLGLAICRRLTTLLEGEIHVRSIPSCGSEFTVIFPLHHSQQPALSS